jgi:uncharacterized membrane protein HdeD (DUF308 family)
VVQTLAQNRLLLALCGVFDVIISAIYFNMYFSSGTLTMHAWNSNVVLLGRLALLAGICTVAAGIWRSSQGKSWLLVVNGISLTGLGLLQSSASHFPISFLAFALLIIVGAICASVLDLTLARSLQHCRADRWLLPAAGVLSAGFAFAFLALGLHWIQMEPGSHMDIAWFASYFGFSAVCILALAVRLHRPDAAGFRVSESLPAR